VVHGGQAVGIVPLTVTFTDQSFRLGTDGTAGPSPTPGTSGTTRPSNVSMISLISVMSAVPVRHYRTCIVQDVDGGTVTKTYLLPGVYDVTLTR
jgi:hypothetical protein